METYLAAWRTFRRLSNENESIAEHLISQPLWPSAKDISVCDLGCGDGRLLEQLVLRSPERISQVCLVDPDQQLVQEAASCINETGLVQIVQTRQESAEEAFPICAESSDVILMVHVVYLLEGDQFKQILAALPLEKPFYLILDSPDSVFFALWERTAPKYRKRVEAAHEYLAEISAAGVLSVNRTDVHSQIQNPLEISREDLRDAVLSLLCYCSLKHLPEGVTSDWIREVLNQHRDDGHIVCQSACYEIIRHGGEA